VRRRHVQEFSQPGSIAILHLRFLHGVRSGRSGVAALLRADDLNCFASRRNSWDSRVLRARRSGSVVSLATRKLTAACASRSSICLCRRDNRWAQSATELAVSVIRALEGLGQETTIVDRAVIGAIA